MTRSYDYDELRTAIRVIRTTCNLEDALHAAELLADYTETTLDLSDEVDAPR